MNYTYTLIKSNRKTYSIRISEDNRIVIRAPKYATQKDIERLISNKKVWIDKVLSFNKNNILNTAEIQEGRCAYVGGKLLPVIYDKINYVDSCGVHITNNNCFKKAYIKGVGEEFLQRFHQIEKQCNLFAKSVKFRSYKSRWGCCDGEHNIIFNYKLMMLPYSLQCYVMVHELCHIIYLNHSADFWALVKKFLPDYIKLRKQLKNYNFLVKMY